MKQAAVRILILVITISFYANTNLNNLNTYYANGFSNGYVNFTPFCSIPFHCLKQLIIPDSDTINAQPED